jgi:undecaprenyl diphosphate synthase
LRRKEELDETALSDDKHNRTLHTAASELLGTVTAEEARLLAALDSRRLPRHIAIIMDGNGRWAKRRSLPRVAGHRSGVRSARMAIETCARLNLEALTLYAFSVENWRRPKSETDFLMQLLREYLRKELPSIHKNNIKFRVLGRLEELPGGVRQDALEAMEMTAKNSGMTLAIALNYGGRAEIVDAVKAILGESHNGRAGEAVDEDRVSRHLYTAGLPDPDLLIRTSGEMRVSNFLLWQIAYAEIYVTETLWPDFSRARLIEAMLEFQKRERRYGGIDEDEGSERPEPIRAAGR